ncbi:MAG: hypothetical protein HKN16_02195 [Saprospiraceae bacterium]|nr:hypothetical protein [Saprospiraceae bacterium]
MLEALNLHRSAILQAAGDGVDPNDKMDILGNTFAAVLNESLSYGSIKKSVKHIDRFSKQNENDLEKIFGDINSHVESLNRNERRRFFLRLATKPYTLDIIKAVPKVEKKISRRINTFIFFNKLQKLLKPEKILGL